MNWLRKWLPKEKDELSPYLDCLIRKKGKVETVRFTIYGSMGLRLVGRDVSGGIRLIGEGEVLDREHFWKLWKNYNKDTKFHWEDGTEFVPE